MAHFKSKNKNHELYQLENRIITGIQFCMILMKGLPKIMPDNEIPRQKIPYIQFFYVTRKE